MARFADRPLQWSDVIGRFEAKSSAEHAHNALGLIGRLKDEGRQFWETDSKELDNWHRYCHVMWVFLNSLRKRRDVDEQSLKTAMREFVREFEHSTQRMYQMMYGQVTDPDNDDRVREMMTWFSLGFQTSVYALLSAWSEDKQETNTLTTTVDLTTGEMRQQGTRTEMQVPKRLKKFTKNL